MAYNALWAELGQRRREPHGPTKGGQQMRHQTLGFGAAAPQGRWGSGPLGLPHLGLVEGLIPSPSPYIRAAPLPLPPQFIPLFLPPLLSSP